MQYSTCMYPEFPTGLQIDYICTPAEFSVVIYDVVEGHNIAMVHFIVRIKQALVFAACVLCEVYHPRRSEVRYL